MTDDRSQAVALTYKDREDQQAETHKATHFVREWLKLESGPECVVFM